MFTVRIEFEATGDGGVAATPPGVHADWPASFSLELVNHDVRPHAIAFTELGTRYDVDSGTKDAPAVVYYILGISHVGTYHWHCVLGCPAPDVEGYVHVAPVD